MKLIFKDREAKRLLGLKVNQGGDKEVDYLEL